MVVLFECFRVSCAEVRVNMQVSQLAIPKF